MSDSPYAPEQPSSPGIQASIWKFSCHEIAQMLSPKDNSREAESSTSSRLVDRPEVLTALNRCTLPSCPVWVSTDERANYLAIQTLFEECIAIARELYNELSGPLKLKPVEALFWPDIFMRTYGRSTHDGIPGAGPLQPAGTIHDREPPTDADWSATWSNKFGPNTFPIRFPIEVKDSWDLILAHIATYMRACVSATPFRAFIPAFEINYDTGEFASFVFHAGGVAAGDPIKLAEEESRHTLVSTLLSVLMWQTPEDAGLPPFCDGLNIRLPSSILPSGNYTNFVISEVLHFRATACGRRSFVALIRPQPEDDQGDGLVPQTTTSSAARNILQSPPCASWSESTHRSLCSATKPSSAPPAPQLKVEGNQSKVPIAIRRFHEQPITEAVATHHGQPLDSVSKGLVLKISWQSKHTQDIEAQVLKVCDGMFGLPRFVCSFDSCTNIGYLPRNDRAENWKDWQQPAADSFLDQRTLSFTVCSEVGETLEYCATPLELIIGLRDAFFGWFNAIQHGYLHRDISIGNILKLKTKVHRKPFAILDPFPNDYDISGLSLGNQQPHLPSTAENEKADMQALKKAFAVEKESLEVLLRSLEVTTECTAILPDFDLAQPLHPSSQIIGDLSGTREFMSTSLLLAIDVNRYHVQSAIDDADSFFNVGIWAMLFNKTHRSHEHTHNYWRDQLQTRERDFVAASMFTRQGKDLPDTNAPEFMLLLVPFFIEWRKRLAARREEWDEIYDEQNPFELTVLQQKLVALWCITDFMSLLEKHLPKLNTF